MPSSNNDQLFDSLLQDTDSKVWQPTIIETPAEYRALQMNALDDMFNRSVGAVIVNSIVKDELIAKQMATAIYSDGEDEVGLASTCECGAFKGRFYEGIICRECGTVVSSAFTDTLSHKLWMDIPPTMSPVLHPIAYMVLSSWLSSRVSGSSGLLDAILNPEKELPDELRVIIPKSGYTYFHNNFDSIIKFFLNVYPKTVAKPITPFIRMFIDTHKDMLFCRKLPILHNALHPITKNGTMKYVDTASKNIVEAIHDLNISAFIHRKAIHNSEYADKALYNVYSKSIEYYLDIVRKKIGSKKGLARQHGLGSRMHKSSRAVITPLTLPIMADELVMPWKLMIGSHRLEIINLLTKRYGYSVCEAVTAHSRAFYNHDPVIEEVFRILIQECPYKGLPVLCGRNPTLCLGAIQLLFATRVKVNPLDESMGISSLISERPNLDFDGDEMNILNLMEMGLVDKFFVIHPVSTILDTSLPQVGASVMVPSLSIVAMNNWLQAAK